MKREERNVDTTRSGARSPIYMNIRRIYFVILMRDCRVIQRVCVTAIRHNHTPRAHADDVLSLITPYLSDIQDIVCVDA